MFYSIENGFLIPSVSKPVTEYVSVFSETTAVSASDKGEFGYLSHQELALFPICNSLSYGQKAFFKEACYA